MTEAGGRQQRRSAQYPPPSRRPPKRQLNIGSQRLHSGHEPCALGVKVGALGCQLDDPFGASRLDVARPDQRFEGAPLTEKRQLKGWALCWGGDVLQRRQCAVDAQSGRAKIPHESPPAY